MTVYYDEQDNLIFEVDGKKFDIDEDSFYCEMTFCENTHRTYAIPELDFTSNDSKYFGDDRFDEYEELDAEILDHIREKNVNRDAN